MGRWTQHEEDTYRLPAGFVRIAYDSDTRQYTFRDTTSGKLYRSAPGEPYGTLSPVSEHHSSRPNAFAPTEGHSRSPTKSQNPFTTFHDILPAHAITTSPTKSSNSRSRFLTSARTHLRSQSTHVPSSSSNVLHSRSKSASDGTVRDRNQRLDYDARHQYGLDINSSSRPRYHPPSPSTSKDTGKPGFSFSSALQSLSRSLTAVRARDRTRQAIPTPHRSGSDVAGLYRRL